MDVHGTPRPAARKEIRCSDCGHVYWVADSNRSARCSACGNIQASGEVANLGDLSQRLLDGAALSLRGGEEKQGTILDRFHLPQNGAEVQALLSRYQVEWQLWAMVVNHFEDPLYHTAYLCQVTGRRDLSRAAERYREHRSVMAVGRDTMWQAEVADLMIERIENLSRMRMEMGGGGGIILPYWLLSLPLGKGVFRIAWITLGLFLGFRLMGLL
jgi:hypothetical protein